MIDRKHCAGCYNDFYNGKQNFTCFGCWSRESAKLVKRKRVSIHQRPPWKGGVQLLPDCYHATGYIFVEPDRER